jgi:hypothetical protein
MEDRHTPSVESRRALATPPTPKLGFAVELDTPSQICIKNSSFWNGSSFCYWDFEGWSSRSSLRSDIRASRRWSSRTFSPSIYMRARKTVVLTATFGTRPYRITSATPLLHFVATSATSSMQSANTCVVRCKTAVGRCSALYRGAPPCSICGARSVQDGGDDDGRRQYDETEHDCLPRPRSYRGKSVSVTQASRLS